MKSTSTSSRIYNSIPQLSRLREEVLLGDVWKQPELAYRDRILVTCAVLAAQGKQEELAVWMGRGIEAGISADEFRGMAVQVTFYAGWPAGLCVGRAGLDIFENDDKA